jgi:c-di-GMP-binding flagellar brake protein YcgR
MQTNTPANRRRWERRPATIPIIIVLKAEDLKVDNSATIVDISLSGMGVKTALALARGERVGVIAKEEFPQVIPTRAVWAREDESSHWIFAGLEFLNTLEG